MKAKDVEIGGIVNAALDRISGLTKEDFHGYRSEVWSAVAAAIREGHAVLNLKGHKTTITKDGRPATPAEIEKKMEEVIKIAHNEGMDAHERMWEIYHALDGLNVR